MKWYSPILLLAVMILATGCPRNEYVVEMKPLGAKFERKLTVWREDGQETNGEPKFVEFPKEELALLKARYPKHESILDGKKHSFIGQFAGSTPNDVGGCGEFTNFVSSLGTAWIYVERFRGNDDLEGRIREATSAADQLVDLIAGWFAAELGQHSKFEDLRGFLSGDVRQDLKNLGVHWWVKSVTGRFMTNAENEFIIRCGQYLVERDYFRPADLPRVIRVSQANDAGTLMLLVRRLVARKLGLPEAQSATGSLAFLADEAAATASFEKFLRTTQGYRLDVKQWEADRLNDPKLPEPKPMDIVSELVVKMTDFARWSSTDQLVVKLATGIPPADSNGQWNEKSGELVWKTPVEGREKQHEFPSLCYAIWSAPDEMSQKKSFGRTIIRGKELFEYCLWRQSLDAAEAKEWDKLLSSLTPDTFKARLEALRFLAEAKAKADAEAPPANLSDVARQLLDAHEETKLR